MLVSLSLLLTLILINAALAMSEIAVVSSRRARLVELADSGRAGARRALQLMAEPTRFLSTVQVGITAIGILSGAIGEATIARRLAAILERSTLLAPHAEALSVGLMVVVLTYVSLILGELVPKRLALTRPEWIASVIAGPMQVLAIVAKPLVHLLTRSTDAVLRLLHVRNVQQPAVTLAEIKALIEQGALEGVFERTEQEMVTNVLDLDDRQVGSVLTPRSDVVFLDVHEPADDMREKLRSSPHSVLPLCDGGIDHVIGFVRASRLLGRMLEDGVFNPASVAETAPFVPQSMSLMKLLQQLKRTHLPMALVIDEYGGVDGLVTLTDVISAIVGDLPAEPGEEPAVVTREDGTLLIDGSLDMEAAGRALGDVSLAGNDPAGDYHTLGGFAMAVLGKIPRTGDVFVRGAYRFEVVDMDGNRVDRLLVSRIPRQTP